MENAPEILEVISDIDWPNLLIICATYAFTYYIGHQHGSKNNR